MKKVIFVLFITMLFLVSCASSGGIEYNTSDLKYTVERSTYAEADQIVKESKSAKTIGPIIKGKYGDIRPNWVTQDLTTEKIFFGVGYAKLPDENDARKIALVEARNSLAEKVYVSTEELIVTYNSQTGKAYEIISKQKAKAALTGVVVEDEWVGPDNTVYVLVSIPAANVLEQMVMNLDTSGTDIEKLQEIMAKKAALID